MTEEEESISKHQQQQNNNNNAVVEEQQQQQYMISVTPHSPASKGNSPLDDMFVVVSSSSRSTSYLSNINNNDTIDNSSSNNNNNKVPTSATPARQVELSDIIFVHKGTVHHSPSMDISSSDYDDNIDVIDVAAVDSHHNSSGEGGNGGGDNGGASIHTSDESSSSSYLSSSSNPLLRKKPYRRVFKTLHKLLSINVIITAIIVVSLAVAVASVLASSLVTSRDIVEDLGIDYRTALARQSRQTLSDMFRVSTQSMDLTIQLFERSYNYTRQVFTDSKQYEGIVNLFRSIITTDSDVLQACLVYDDGASIWISYDAPNYVLYTASKYTNYTATVRTYNSSTAMEPSSVTYIEHWDQRIFNNTIWKLANSYNPNITEWVMSRPFTTRFQLTNAYGLSKQLFDDRGQKYGVLLKVFSISKIEKLLNNTQKRNYILVTDTEGSFVSCTLRYDVVLHSLNSGGEYVPLYKTNNTELTLFQRAVEGKYGGWGNIRDIVRLRYKSPSLGYVTVRKSIIQFPNQEWYIFIAWPESEWTDRINRTTKINIGIAIAVLLVAIVAALFLSIPVTRSINKIKVCFHKVRTMDLDAPAINDALKSKYLWYEPAELQSSFKSMLLTLRSFQKYVPAHVVQKLVNRGLEASLGLHPKSCTIFFLDLKNFTLYSEQLSASALVQMVGEIFEEMSSIIQDQHQGIIDKYIGDCIMAYWQDKDHEYKACCCALDCENAMKVLSKSFTERDLPEMQCRIGISSGRVLVGNFGSKTRFNWTLVGDSVNLAARVEALNKQYNSTVLITEYTAKKLPRNCFVLRRMDRVIVKGKGRAVLIYELMKRVEQLTSDEYDSLDIYQRAFDLYVAGHFTEAQRLFETIPYHLSDPVVVKKIEQCQQFRDLSAESWNGVLRMDNK